MEHRVIRSRVLIAVIIVGSVFILTAGAALAAGSAGVSPSRVHEANDGPGGVSSPYVTSGIGGGEHVTGSLMISLCITTVFTDVSPDVFTLRSEGYGFGEVVMAYFLAREGDCGEGSCDVDDILEMRQLPMGWGEIFKEVYGSASHRDRNLGQIISGHLPVSGTVSVAAQRLAGRLGTTPEAVQDLLDDGAGYGTIVVAYRLAGELGATPEELVEKRLAGSGWGQIKRELSSAALTTAESQEGPPDHGGPPDHAGGPEDKGPPDHAGPKDHSGPPDHAGPKDNNKHSK
jgi:hypothetical protein